jgi:integrase
MIGVEAMSKQRTGYVYFDKERRAWTARLTYKDALGKTKNLRRQVANKTEGNQVIKKLLREIEDHGAQILDGDRLSFKELAHVYEEKRLFAPTITPSGKVIGLKSYQSARRRLKTLTAYFGAKRIRAITHADIEDYKRARLATPPQRYSVRRDKLEAKLDQLKAKRPRKGTNRAAEIEQTTAALRELNRRLTAGQGSRSEADVNRDLQLLRNVLNFALRQGWMTKNPFSLGEPLISQAVEVRRERVLSRAEEEKLLLACTGPRAHLKPILICALDTAMRRGEIFQLRWKDVDLAGGEITVRATITKSGKERSVPISSRLRWELTQLQAAAPPDIEGRVFGIINSIKKGFSVACELAGVEGFRFHDARHTAITRWIEQGMPPMQVMAISGHTQMQTFVRYINTNRSAIHRAAEAMDAFHAAK